jgi:hypothetical protein
VTESHGHSRPVTRDAPQKYGSIIVGAAALALAGWMTVESLDPRPLKATADAGVDASSTATTATSAGPVILVDAGAATIDLDAGLTLPTLTIDAALPTGGPRSVKLGIVMVTFAGAEGAPPGSRPKGQAKEIADGLLSMARADFHQAVGKGDTGSGDDLGRFPRGILDPNVEAVVFSLGQNDVSEVVETPRGYWIVKRLD